VLRRGGRKRALGTPVAARRHVEDAQPDQVAAPQLGLQGAVEQGEIANSIGVLAVGPSLTLAARAKISPDGSLVFVGLLRKFAPMPR
jgi:hypothetical protein